jgi:hypothetical protein
MRLSLGEQRDPISLVRHASHRRGDVVRRALLLLVDEETQQEGY